jgi:hypothetical protein
MQLNQMTINISSALLMAMRLLPWPMDRGPSAWVSRA